MYTNHKQAKTLPNVILGLSVGLGLGLGLGLECSGLVNITGFFSYLGLGLGLGIALNFTLRVQFRV